MKSIGGFNFSFNYKSYFESCDFDEQQLNECCKINEVQQICMLKENMNDFKVSSRVCKPRIVEKKSSKNLQTFSLLCCKQNRDSKNSKTIDLTHKKTRKEEIQDLLHLCAIERKRSSSINTAKHRKRKHLLCIKNFKSHITPKSNDEFTELKQKH